MHATAMTIYQKTEVGDKSVDLEITGSARDRSIADLPETIPELLRCPNSASKPINPVYATYSIETENDLTSASLKRSGC